MSDIHGEHRILGQVLERCRASKVDGIILLGDLFDRLDQAERCARQLVDWPVFGVLGNHEREAISEETSSGSDEATRRVLRQLVDRLLLDDALFIHDEMELKEEATNTAELSRPFRPHIVFAGHTHHRMARDETGPLDLSLGRIRLRPEQRYLVNPGAVIEGKFVIWDRADAVIKFERV